MGRTSKDNNLRGVISSFEGFSSKSNEPAADVLKWAITPMPVLNYLREPNSITPPIATTDINKEFADDIDKKLSQSRTYLSNYNNYNITNFLSPDDKIKQTGYNSYLVWRMMNGTNQTNKILNDIFASNFKKPEFVKETKDLTSYLKQINNENKRFVLNKIRINKIEQDLKSLTNNKTEPWKFSINAQTAGEKLSLWNGGKYKQIKAFAYDLSMVNRNATLANRNKYISDEQKNKIFEKTSSLMFKIQKINSSVESAKSAIRSAAIAYEATPKAREEMKTYFKEYFTYDNPYR
jgi:hypothetical protein